MARGQAPGHLRTRAIEGLGEHPGRGKRPKQGDIPHNSIELSIVRRHTEANAPALARMLLRF